MDRRNSGSHKDMDCFTFMSSAASLWPYFQKCAQMGMETAQEPPKETFRRLRWAGKIAGYDMNQATNGVNTHKGALFSIGILCGALGRLLREKCKSCIGRMCGDDKRNC
uniref:triphosphoribosyl-dephospho-CoA synthase n=1 Tax=Enterocloster clostridioformis TaxID=1531 RepID=UPI002A82890D|nr:triphosphoribosyl-dephospho-CoA synthase [Enterocloster clostridioformis]